MRLHVLRSLFPLAILAGCRPSAAPSEAAPRVNAPAPARGDAASIDALAFLVGTWIAETPEGRVTEAWTKQGDALVGRSETVGAQPFHEDLRIEAKDGVLVYFASPMGRTPPTEFRRTDDGSAANVVVFENPAHDFPKRIRYAQNGDRLTATIDGDGKGASWEYQRAP
ncbi:MAG TPA: DUF6265 family protein [Nannocystaceae bacterium]|nr:DUF6265 family protein [Nannocystaceae bacterium]